MKFATILFFACLLMHSFSNAQHEHHATEQPAVKIEAQPLLAQVTRLQQALEYLGSPLQKADATKLDALKKTAADEHTIHHIQEILDPYCLASVRINPEARVSVERGPASATLVQGGWKSFLIKVYNEAGVKSALNVRSENAAPLLHGSEYGPEPNPSNILSAAQVANRFLEIGVYRNRPLQPTLSGLALEYVVVQIFTKDKGQREASLSFSAGQGTEDIGFRNAISVLFNCKPSSKVVFNIKDENGEPAMASFIIKDNIERLLPDTVDYRRNNYRYWRASNEYNVYNKSLRGLYPLPSRRLALTDEYPDFFFQPQVYRYDGEHVNLPPGHYTITYTRGPEYITQTKDLIVPENAQTINVDFRLKRWINMANMKWYSADHHIHAAGCSHYESPEEGVNPDNMIRQVKGEDLNVGAVLSWGPGWYHQKQFFTGEVSPLSSKQNVMRYDVEVSGFPSSHAGHLVLLNLKEDDYPGTKTIEDWPTWTAPVLQWAKNQHALTGYAHSGWGLEPTQPTTQLPNDVLPKMDGIGANEYVVTVTKNLVDFYSAGDTPAPWELNMWYHSLNCGFRTRLSGETDFPCIFDERVGIARSYFKADGPLTYDAYMDALKKGRNYVSEGHAHLIDFTANNSEMGNGDVALAQPGKVHITAKAAALLSLQQDEDGKNIATRSLTESPYWHIERARIGASRKVRVQLIFNGVAVDSSDIEADGKWNNIEFNYAVNQSGWMALRVYPSAHTNPIFINVGGKPVADAKSAAWCLKAVDQCWQMKQDKIKKEELAAAEQLYNEARKVYQQIIDGKK